MLIAMLNKYHYEGLTLNDKVSEQIFNDFIDALDPYSTIFTEVELKKLEPFKFAIDDADNTTICNFLKLSTELYHERLTKIDTLVGSILNKPFDLSAKDTITFYPISEKITSANDIQLEKRWRRRLKFKTLEIIFSATEENQDPVTSDNKTLLLKEPEARKQIRTKEKRFIKRILEYPMGFENYVTVKFNNVIANRFDPHTLYFSSLEKENFDAGLSKEAKSFGLSFAEGKNGEIVIGSLTPGGPAWKSSELHKDDVVLKIKWPEQEPIDLAYSSPSEVESLIHSSTSDKIELTIRQGNGMINPVSLYREVIAVEENNISGFVLNGNKKVGYISLPGFYTEMNTSRALGCANDVAKEIIKLKQENIEGLILDLRFNGGGSLYEAVNLAGIFIDEGPFCLMKDKNSKPQLMKDINRGTIYNGPMVIMVNGFSASASEIFTAGMKDYNRALVVGSTTYGKSIGQITIPLDTSLNLNNYIDEASANVTDYVNVTRSKFYGIDGISHQYAGVRPDIELPDFYNNKLYGEASSPYALKADSIVKKVIFNPLPVIPKTALSTKSESRIALNNSFKRIRTISDSLQKEKNERKKLVLTLDGFKKYQAALNQTEKDISRLSENPSEKFKVSSTQYDEELLKVDTYKKEVNDVLIKNIQNDLYIEENYLIMQDYINSINNK
jgi:carboxyl-terminal processing protease